MLPKFKNKKFLEKALTHPSYGIKRTDHNFERFEFLGDRVLGLIIAEELMKRHPSENEGKLAKKFSLLVSKEVCKDVFFLMGANEILKANQKELQMKTTHIYSDSCEALIGALYMDQGLEKTKEFVLTHWKKFIEGELNAISDAKSMLQEYVQKKYKTTPIYNTIKIEGEDHTPHFTVEVSLSDGKKATGKGLNKKLAEKDAAKNLLNLFKLKN